MSATRPAKNGSKAVPPAKAPAHLHQAPDNQLSPAAQRYLELGRQSAANAQRAYRTELRGSDNPLGAAAQRYSDLGAPRSANTQRAYGADLRNYEAFCKQRQFTPYPADLATLTGYLTHLADQQKKLSTIRRHVTAIHQRHRLRQLPSVVGTPELNKVLRGIAKKAGACRRVLSAFFAMPRRKRTRPYGRPPLLQLSTSSVALRNSTWPPPPACATEPFC